MSENQSDYFDVRWQVDSGYVGNPRTHTTRIYRQDYDNCETDQEREQLIADSIQDDFLQKISWVRVS